MLNLGTGEVLVILVVALLVLGPDKLPSAARQMGRALSELRRMSAGFQAELRDAIQEPVDVVQEPMRSMRATLDEAPADGERAPEQAAGQPAPSDEEQGSAPT